MIVQSKHEIWARTSVGPAYLLKASDETRSYRGMCDAPREHRLDADTGFAAVGGHFAQLYAEHSLPLRRPHRQSGSHLAINVGVENSPL
jgi:hypothetical protein